MNGVIHPGEERVHSLVVPVRGILPPMRGGAPDTLTIDPVTLVTWANEAAPNTNYGGDTTFRYGVVGTKEVEFFNQFSFHRADISAISGIGATVLNTSRYRCYVQTYSAPVNGQCGTILTRTSEEWGELTLTYTNRPAEGNPSGTIDDPTATGWFEYASGVGGDVLMEILQDALDNRAGNMNWAMRPLLQALESWEIRSDDYADADFRPKLIIDYTVPSVGGRSHGYHY